MEGPLEFELSSTNFPKDKSPSPQLKEGRLKDPTGTATHIHERPTCHNTLHGVPYLVVSTVTEHSEHPTHTGNTQAPRPRTRRARGAAFDHVRHNYPPNRQYSCRPVQ